MAEDTRVYLTQSQFVDSSILKLQNSKSGKLNGARSVKFKTLSGEEFSLRRTFSRGSKIGCLSPYDPNSTLSRS